MTQEDKELLLKDLCARLPYGVLCEDMEGKTRPLFGITPTQHFIVTLDNATDVTNGLKFCTIDYVKPYLRPMLSMTEEEIEELKKLCSIYIPTDSPTIGFEEYGIIVFTHHLTNNMYSFKLNVDVIDWLNKKMFDYRTDDEGKTMTEKGIALKAPEGMYNIKER